MIFSRFKCYTHNITKSVSTAENKNENGTIHSLAQKAIDKEIILITKHNKLAKAVSTLAEKHMYC
jgi:hypothetical protein